MHLAITIWAIIASWRAWNLEHFHKFHATILYKSTMNLLYIFITMGYPLWRIQPDLGLPFIIISLLYTFIIFPCTVILFLSNYPKSAKSQILHNLKWITIYIVVEWIGSLSGRITYEHGWNLGWSLLFVIIMFPMLGLHHKRPILTYFLSIIIVTLMIYFFNIPWKLSLEDRL